MLRIRLQRIGRKNNPVYRLVISERAKDTQGRSLEILGKYDPVSTDKKLILEEDRIKYWIGNGAQPSNTVYNLLVKAGVIEDKKKKKSVAIKKKRGAKLTDKKAKAEEDKKAKAEAKKQAEEEAKAKAAEEAAAAKAEKEAPAEVVEAPAEDAPKEEEKKAEAPVEETPKEEAKEAKE